MIMEICLIVGWIVILFTIIKVELDYYKLN